MKRRSFLKGIGSSLLIYPVSPIFASKNSQKNKKVVWVVLRGALDSLSTVIPIKDKYLKLHRPNLCNLPEKEMLKINDDFSFHPSLINLHNWFENKELTIINSAYSGFKKRSHFDGQDYLESGLTIPDTDNGWLSRAIDIKNKKAIAISNTIPISLRSSSNVQNWLPLDLHQLDNDVYKNIESLYSNDNDLLESFKKGIASEQLFPANKSKKKVKKFSKLAKLCGAILSENNNYDCAMLEMGGWDTHYNQVSRLNKQLNNLDTGLNQLRVSLGEQWDNTLVIVATEFGRTVKENGTKGTDHGTASCMFITGGASNGGQVLGDWPGIKDEFLFEGRDLMPTSYVFSWIATALKQHWELEPYELFQVFPNTELYNENLTK
jgi:uncharacterized protein (DUF1501 family)